MLLVVLTFQIIPHHVNIPQLFVVTQLHLTHVTHDSTSPIWSDGQGNTVNIIHETILSVMRLHLHFLCFIIFGCYIDTLHIDVNIVFTCTVGSRRIHWGRWWVQRFLLPETRRPVISSLGESSPRSKHTPAPAHDNSWHEIWHNVTWYDRSDLFFVTYTVSE